MSDATCTASPEDQQAGLSVPPSGLVLASTPIGNLGDMTGRARQILGSADRGLGRDARPTGGLLTALGVRARLQALHEHNEDASIPHLLELLRQNKLIALVSDAGTPLVSDP